MQQQRDHLNGLAQPHIVGKACAQAQPGEKSEPMDSGFLIGAEIAAKAARNGIASGVLFAQLA